MHWCKRATGFGQRIVRATFVKLRDRQVNVGVISNSHPCDWIAKKSIELSIVSIVFIVFQQVLQHIALASLLWISQMFGLCKILHFCFLQQVVAQRFFIQLPHCFGCFGSELGWLGSAKGCWNIWKINWNWSIERPFVCRIFSINSELWLLVRSKGFAGLPEVNGTSILVDHQN